MNKSGFAEFFGQNKSALLATAIVLFVAVAGGLFWTEQRHKREREATNFLFDAQTEARKLSAAGKYQEAEKLYAPLLEKFPGSRPAYEARLLIGDLWMDAGDFAAAAKHYEAAVKSAGDDFSRVLAGYNLGIARESAGQYQEAVQSYEEALRAKGSEFLRPEILMAQARCYEAMRQNGKAIELYKAVQEKYAAKTYYSGAASAYEKQLNAKPN